jgi:hypothetical protein
MQRIFFVPSVVAKSGIQMESAVVGAFVEFVTKLNDTAFRPLFRKLFDWAFTGTPQNVMYHRMRSLNVRVQFQSQPLRGRLRSATSIWAYWITSR